MVKRHEAIAGRRKVRKRPKGALQVNAALADFAVPKLSRQEVKAEADAKVKIHDQLQIVVYARRYTSKVG